MAEMFQELTSDSREERAYRMWVNSLGVEGVHLQNIYDDLKNGVMLLRILDHLSPSSVGDKLPYYHHLNSLAIIYTYCHHLPLHIFLHV
jgi:hypothetical protein